MPVDVLFHPLAAEDLERIDTWLAARSPAAADALLARLDGLCASLGDFPEQGRLRPTWGEGVRSMTIDRTSLVAYRREGDTVVLLRLFQAGQDIDASMAQDAEPDV